MRDYSIVPLEINKYSDLDDLDEHEAKEAGWPPSLISAAVHEIHRREMEPNKQPAPDPRYQHAAAELM